MEHTHEFKHEQIKGHIKYKLLPGVERLKLARDCSKEIDKDGNLKELDNASSSIKYIDALKNNTIEVKAKIGTKEINDFDELSMYEEGFALLVEAAVGLIRGIELGKPQKRS